MNCISNTIIGLSQTECDCFDAGKPIDYNTSDSGLFITDVVDINTVVDLTDCASGDVWQLLEDSRKYGIKHFKRNFKSMFNKYFKKDYRDCKTQIGSDKRNGKVYTGTSTWLGSRIEANNLTGSYITIKNINTFFTETGTVDLHIYSNYSGDVIDTITLNTTANKKEVNRDINITLPLFESDCEDLEYYFIYEIQGTNVPLVNACFCGCGSKKCYSRFYNMNGIEYSTFPSDFSDYEVTQSSCNGLEIEVTAFCNEADILCPIDYTTDRGNLVAELIQYESALYLINRMLTGQRYNFDIETLNRKKKLILGTIDQYKDDLITELRENTPDCISCQGWANSRLL